MLASNGRSDFQPQHRIAQEEDSFTRSDKVRVEGAIDGEASTQTTSWIRNQKILKDVWNDTSTLCGRNILYKYQVLCTELNPWQLPSNLTIIPNMSVSDIETQTKCMASYGFLSPFLLRLRFSSCEVQQFTFLTSKESGRCWNHHCQSCQNVRIQQRIAGDFPSNLSKWISNIHKLPQMFVEKRIQEVSPRISRISWVKIPCGWKPRKLLSGRISSNAPRKAVAE